MPNAAARPLYVPDSAHVARTLLTELRSAHRELMWQISAMEKLTREPAFDPKTCTNGRWRLSQASLARRLLASRIGDFFLVRVSENEREDLKSLMLADQALLRDSSAHLGRWSGEGIKSDWPNFCREAREMFRKTQRHIALEQRVLYPLLEQSEGGGARQGAWRE